jgi:DeoR/GlpR family transcriptional regulator of sugar metabolism
MALITEQRLSEICRLVKDRHEVSICELAEKFSVSEMTIHRDLKKLENQGQIRKLRGMAVPAERMEFEFDFSERRSTNLRAKEAIAKKAFEMVSEGMSFILDTGTTTLELAYLLKNCSDITVVTPSLAVSSVLQFSTEIETVLLGGIIRKGSPDLTGTVTEHVLDLFMVDAVFQGADGIGLNGELYNSDLRIAKVDKKMRTRAHRTVIMCDSSKIAKTNLATNGNLGEVDTLITDDRIAECHLSELKKYNTEIITVHI